MPLKKEAAHRKDLTSGLCHMEHRHFAAIATILRESNNCTRDVCVDFAYRLAETNPAFDKHRFLVACGC